MRNLEHQSISGEFERFAKQPIALIIFVSGALLGPGAIIHAIDLIGQDKIQTGIWFAAAGTGEITAAGAIAFANIKSMVKSKHFENPQSPEQSSQQ